MTQLDSNDFTQIKKLIRRYPAVEAEVKAWGLDRPTWMALFQAAEDWFVNGFNSTPTSSFKAALEAAAGPMTANQAKWLGRIWFEWRIGEVW